MACAKVKPGVGGLHFWTGYRGAIFLELDDQQVQFVYELTDVLVLPQGLMDYCLVLVVYWNFYNLFDI